MPKSNSVSLYWGGQTHAKRLWGTSFGYPKLNFIKFYLFLLWNTINQIINISDYCWLLCIFFGALGFGLS